MSLEVSIAEFGAIAFHGIKNHQLAVGMEAGILTSVGSTLK